MSKVDLKVERRKFVHELFKKQFDANPETKMTWAEWIKLVMKDYKRYRKDYMNDPVNAQIFTPSRRLRKRGTAGDHWFRYTYLNSPITRKFIRDRAAKNGRCFSPLPFNGMVSTTNTDTMQLSQRLTYGATKSKIKNDNLRNRFLNGFGHGLAMISTRLRLPATT